MGELFVLGNASIDATLRVPRLPLAGETLMATGLARAPGGKGLNQAVVAARAGARVRFCAPVGREPEAAIIPAALGREPFGDIRLIETEAPTDLSTLIVAADGANMIISTGDAADAITPYVARVFARPMGEGDWLLVQGNLPEAATWTAVERAPRVIVNTAPIRWVSRRILERAAVVIANEVEAAEITGIADPERAAPALGGEVGIVTLGAAGCVVAGEGGTQRFAAPAVTAVDTTGAGDVFCGVLAAALVEGLGVADAVAWAQRAAALAVGRAGCFGAFPTSAELAGLR